MYLVDTRSVMSVKTTRFKTETTSITAHFACMTSVRIAVLIVLSNTDSQRFTLPHQVLDAMLVVSCTKWTPLCSDAVSVITIYVQIVS